MPAELALSVAPVPTCDAPKVHTLPVLRLDDKVVDAPSHNTVPEVLLSERVVGASPMAREEL